MALSSSRYVTLIIETANPAYRRFSPSPLLYFRRGIHPDDPSNFADGSGRRRSARLAELKGFVRIYEIALGRAGPSV